MVRWSSSGSVSVELWCQFIWAAARAERPGWAQQFYDRGMQVSVQGGGGVMSGGGGGGITHVSLQLPAALCGVYQQLGVCCTALCDIRLGNETEFQVT